MSGSFSTADQHHFVRNLRFRALMEWAIEVAVQINDPKSVDYISKMQRGYDGLYSLCTDIDLDQVLDQEEKVFWSKAFQLTGHQLFQRTIGTTETDHWRPSAIADALTVSRMLQQSSGVSLDYTQTEF